MMIFTDCIHSILSTLDQKFNPNELAYLAATSKVEGPIRDKIAHELHVREGSSVLVHREWRDRNDLWTDLAITDEQNNPKFLVELKAHSAPTFEQNYSNLIRKDLKKLYEAADEETELCLIFLLNHLYHPGTIDSKYKHSIKYYELQNRASKLNEFTNDASKATSVHWKRHLEEIGIFSKIRSRAVCISAGLYYEMPIWIHAYILGPFYREELKTLFH